MIDYKTTRDMFDLYGFEARLFTIKRNNKKNTVNVHHKINRSLIKLLTTDRRGVYRRITRTHSDT